MLSSLLEVHTCQRLGPLQPTMMACRQAVWGGAAPCCCCRGQVAAEHRQPPALAAGDTLEVRTYERLAPLRTSRRALQSLGHARRGDCVVSFSRREVHSVRHKIEAQGKHKCCLVRVEGMQAGCMGMAAARQMCPASSGREAGMRLAGCMEMLAAEQRCKQACVLPGKTVRHAGRLHQDAGQAASYVDELGKQDCCLATHHCLLAATSKLSEAQYCCKHAACKDHAAKARCMPTQGAVW